MIFNNVPDDVVEDPKWLRELEAGVVWDAETGQIKFQFDGIDLVVIDTGDIDPETGVAPIHVYDSLDTDAKTIFTGFVCVKA